MKRDSGDPNSKVSVPALLLPVSWHSFQAWVSACLATLAGPMEATRNETTGCSYIPYISILPVPKLELPHAGHLKSLCKDPGQCKRTLIAGLCITYKSGKPAKESRDPDSGYQVQTLGRLRSWERPIPACACGWTWIQSLWPCGPKEMVWPLSLSFLICLVS